MKIRRFNESNNIIFDKHFIGTIDHLTEDSKNTLLKIFGTLNFPYDLQIFNHSASRGKRGSQSVNILDVDVYILKKLLKVSFLSSGNIFQKHDKINISFMTGDIYSGNEISIEKRYDDGRLMFSIPIARYENNKWKIYSGQDGFQFIHDNKVSLTQDDLYELEIKRNMKKYNLI